MDKVLIVDDSQELAEVCELVLSGAGYQVVTAPNGRQGLDQVRRLHPDVVLLDMMMPEMDGLEFLDELAALDERPRVVAYSGFDEFERLALQRGAAAFLRKPFDPAQLLGTVETVRRDATPSEATLAEQRAHVQAARALQRSHREDLMRRIRIDDASLRAVLEPLVVWLQAYFGVDRALVTGLRDRMFVLASATHGEVISGTACDPSETFCPGVVQAGAPFVLRDGASHPAYADHPAVARGVRSYAGAPLIVTDTTVGTLCLEHLRPFAFGAEDMALLAWFARRVSERLGARMLGQPAAPILEGEHLLPFEAFLVVVDAQLRAAERDRGGVQLIVISADEDERRVLLRAIDRAAGAVGLAITALERDRIAVAVRAPSAEAAIGRSDLVLIAADAMLDGPRIGIAHWDPSAALFYPAARFVALAELAHRRAAFRPARLFAAAEAPAGAHEHAGPQ